jgi:hypothetical protein
MPIRQPFIYLPHGGGPSFFLPGDRKRLYQPMEEFLRAIRGALGGVRAQLHRRRAAGADLRLFRRPA